MLARTADRPRAPARTHELHALTDRRASGARRAGVRVSYVVSEPGTARITIERLERRGNAARIERTKLRGCFRHGAVPGRNKLRFTGYLLGRVLTPGRYDLVVTVSDVAGERSRAKRTGLRILR